MAYYAGKLNRYGLPLDSRAGYTKLDWSLWTATLASKQSQFEAIVDPIYRWMNETQSRVPLTDWYDTTTGLQEGFQAAVLSEVCSSRRSLTQHSSGSGEQLPSLRFAYLARPAGEPGLRQIHFCEAPA